MLLGAASVAIALLVVVLAMPIDVRFDISWRGELEQRIDLSWAFGLVRKRLAPTDAAGSDAQRPTGSRRERVRSLPRDRRAHLLAALRLKAFRRRLLRFTASLWRAVHKDGLRLDVQLGLGDPADTGRFWAFLVPLSLLLQRVPDIAISLEPDFHDATFELESSGALRVVPLNIVFILVALLVSPDFWRGLRVIRRGA